MPYRGPLSQSLYQLIGGLKAGDGLHRLPHDRGAAPRRGSCASRRWGCASRMCTTSSSPKRRPTTAWVSSDRPSCSFGAAPRSGRSSILDFGGQYTQLIARRVREESVYSEIHPFNLSRGQDPRAGAARDHPLGRARVVYAAGAPRVEPRVYELGRADAGHLLRHAADGAAARRQGGADRAARSTAGRR